MTDFRTVMKRPFAAALYQAEGRRREKRGGSSPYYGPRAGGARGRAAKILKGQQARTPRYGSL